jgi:lipoyl(octanoyl) transferase
MNRDIKLLDWGTVDYDEAFIRQEQMFNETIENKKIGAENSNVLILCEHPHVYTLGKSGKQTNMLMSEEYLSGLGIKFVHTNRGGDITYHGQGQIVGYPIFDLDNFHLGLKDYIYKVEDAIIRTIAHYGIKGARLNGATGVWLDVDVPGRQRKICAIGVRASHFVTMHGFALNVNTDLQYFRNINPCGFVDKGVCSIASELGREIDIEETKRIVFDAFREVFA